MRPHCDLGRVRGSYAGSGRNTGVSMSGHWRFCVSAFVVATGVYTSPAFSNPLTDLFNLPAKEAAAPAPAPAAAREECVPQPGRSTAPGRHWVYRLDGHRKCWFQADEATVSLRKRAHHYIAREENEAAPRKGTTLDARAQVLGAAPGDAFQPPASAPGIADTASVPASSGAPPMPAAPIAAPPAIDQPASDRATPRSVDVEMLLAASSLAEDMSASAAPADPASSEDASEYGWESMAKWAGAALIALGLIFLAGSLLASRFFDPGLVLVRRT